MVDLRSLIGLALITIYSNLALLCIFYMSLRSKVILCISLPNRPFVLIVIF